MTDTSMAPKRRFRFLTFNHLERSNHKINSDKTTAFQIAVNANAELDQIYASFQVLLGIVQTAAGYITLAYSLLHLLLDVLLEYLVYRLLTLKRSSVAHEFNYKHRALLF